MRISIMVPDTPEAWGPDVTEAEAVAAADKLAEMVLAEVQDWWPDAEVTVGTVDASAGVSVDDVCVISDGGRDEQCEELIRDYIWFTWPDALNSVI